MHLEPLPQMELDPYTYPTLLLGLYCKHYSFQQLELYKEKTLLSHNNHWFYIGLEIQGLNGIGKNPHYKAERFFGQHEHTHYYQKYNVS